MIRLNEKADFWWWGAVRGGGGTRVVLFKGLVLSRDGAVEGGDAFWGAVLYGGGAVQGVVLSITGRRHNTPL